MATATQLARIEKEWNVLAGEKLKVQQTGAAYYAFGSELSCLRLFFAYRYSVGKATVAKSQNLNTWFFRLEV